VEEKKNHEIKRFFKFKIKFALFQIQFFGLFNYIKEVLCYHILKKSLNSDIIDKIYF
jgi:hypothetical protein